jgi:hypothetical protein
VAYAASIVGAAATTVGDDFSTVEGIATGEFREGSPILVTADGGYNRGLKYGLAAGVGTANHFLVWRRRQYKTAIVVNGVLTLVQGIAWANNERLIRAVNAPEPLPTPPALFRLRF